MRHSIRASVSIKLLAIFLSLTFFSACSDNDDTDITTPIPVDPEFADYTVVSLAPGDDLEARALEALIQAAPKTIIEFPAGYYEFDGELSVATDNIVLRGQGMEADGGTVLNFRNQTSGGQSIHATANNFVAEDLAVEDSPGDAIKIRGANGVTLRRVRVEWTNGPDSENGAYGLYPVQCRNVLIEDTRVRGASDAGVYVGQSEIIIVRRNYVWENVAGIEIENSKFADVYDNETTANTGGILVFDLPGPPVQGGQAVRVFDNLIYDNNTPNFAPEGNIVGLVPTGTGLMIMANDDIEAFNNEITGNQSAGIVVVSYYINDVGISKPTYDPVPEKIYLHDNVIDNNGYDPQMLAEAISDIVFGGEDGVNVDVFYDSSGVGTDAGLLLEFPDGLSENQAICIRDNSEGINIGQANASVLLAGLPFDPAISLDPAPFQCAHASLPEIVLEPPVEPGDPIGPANPLELCDAPGEGINAQAFEADCPRLSDYRLFADAGNPLENANSGIEYDLNTPLFTDYAKKYRFVFVPAGAQAAYRETEAFDFPVGTIISKTFTIKADLRDDASSEDIIETRLLIRRAGGWTALPYIWNEERTDALLTETGGTQSVSWIDASGEARSTDYVIPNTNNCANCHGERDPIPIGPTAKSLNKSFAYASGGENQIAHWTDAGILTGAPADLSGINTIPPWQDDSADLGARARGYLDINCAHCHSPTGAGSTSGLFLEYERPFGFEVGECKPPVAAGAGSGGLDYVVVPGDSDNSILTFRMDSNETDVRMPEIGRSIIHPEGVELIEEWINNMEARDC